MTWYVACLSRELRAKPLARTVGGTPLALFRAEGGGPAAALDRCPHRNVPLSCGSVHDGLLECCYHGWRFDGTGECRLVPGLTGDADRRARRATTYPAAEQDGFVWVATGGVEAEYVGEPRPEGLAGRVLAPEGGIVTHVDRFLLPSIAQVEYRLGANHLLVTSAFTPVGEHETLLHSAVTFSLRLPHAPVKAAVLPIANRILSQDARILRLQSQSVRRFGGEHFASTDLDVLGQHVRKLLRQAERGESPPGDGAAAAEPERRVRMRV